MREHRITTTLNLKSAYTAWMLWPVSIYSADLTLIKNGQASAIASTLMKQAVQALGQDRDA